MKPPRLYELARKSFQTPHLAGAIGVLFACALGCSGGETPSDDGRPSAGAAGTGGSGAMGGSGGTATGGSGGTIGGAPTGGTSGNSTTGGSGGSGQGGTSGATGGSGTGGVSTGGSTATGGSGATGGTAGSGGGAGGSGGGAGSSAGGSGGTSGSGGSAGSSGSAGAPVLDQANNPIYDQLSTYRDWLSTAGGNAALDADRDYADNMLTWQLPHGGFDKNGASRYDAPWNGSDPRSGWTGEGGVELGTIDNDATVTEIMFLADVYARSGNAAYRDGARRALDFLFTMQYPSGGFPQVYPERVNTEYSNYVTFNDNAMVRALVLMHEIVRQTPPLDGDVFTAEQRTKAATAITDAVGYILAAQIEQDGVKTVWCAQHHPTNYTPLGARSYELPSKSGQESVGVILFLMTQPQTAEVEAAVRAGIAWYKDPDVQLENTRYVSRPSGSTDDNYNPIQSSAGNTMWCRFYDLDEDVCFFSGRLPTDNPPGTGKQYDIMDIEPERRYGYQWGGSYGSTLFMYTDSVGY